MNRVCQPIFYNNCGKILIFVFLSFASSNAVLIFGQSDEDTLIYSAFDDLIGNQNSGIFTGEVYIDKFRDLKEGHKFFETKAFRKGWVLYDNQFYYNPVFNYDVHTDNLLVMNSNNSNAPIIVLDKSRIEAFEIDGHQFLNRNISSNAKEPEGFYEILMRSDTVYILKKHKKKIIKKIDDGVYYKFKDTPIYYLANSGELFRIKRLKDIIDFVPKYRTLLQEFPRLFKSSNKVGFESDLLDLIGKLQNFSTKKLTE